jgi:hypothetical protein
MLCSANCLPDHACEIKIGMPITRARGVAQLSAALTTMSRGVTSIDWASPAPSVTALTTHQRPGSTSVFTRAFNDDGHRRRHHDWAKSDRTKPKR